MVVGNKYVGAKPKTMTYHGTVTITTQVEAETDEEAKLKVVQQCQQLEHSVLYSNTQVMPNYEDD